MTEIPFLRSSARFLLLLSYDISLRTLWVSILQEWPPCQIIFRVLTEPLSHVIEDIALPIVRMGRKRVEFDGAVIGLQGLLVPLQIVEDVAPPIVRMGRKRVEFDGAVIGLQGLLVPLQIAEDVAPPTMGI